MRFFLGTHMPSWLAKVAVPLFVSDRRLRGRRTLPRALGQWALDSGGFTELSTYGSWDYGPTPREYADRVRGYQDRIGGLLWAAPMDWMCEPFITGKTGKTVADHQSRTVANLLELRSLAPDLPIIPVLQGWALGDYLACIDLYRRAGIDLAAETVVGVGSVCRRQGTGEAAAIMDAITRELPGVRLHGFGVKTAGLAEYGDLLASADSLAWSYNARRHPPLPGCPHQSCASCLIWAMQWRERVLSAPHRPQQLRLEFA